MPAPETAPKDRLQQFFRFVASLEEQPFFTRFAGGGTMVLSTHFAEAGADTASVSFDETHLEAFLGRLRQFLKDGEFFCFKDIRRCIVDLFGEDAEFMRFYNHFVASFVQKPFSNSEAAWFRADGRNVTAGFTFTELVEAHLYTGVLHSERIVHPRPDSAEEALSDSHIAVRKHLVLTIARNALTCVENIAAFRNWALRFARASSQVDLFPEMREFDERSKAAGV